MSWDKTTIRLDDDRAEAARGAVLYVSAAPEQRDVGRSVRLTSGDLVIGKGPACELSLSDPAISSQHARVAIVLTGIEVEDLDSTNGTKLSGHRITKVTLSSAAQLKLGKTTIDVVPIGSFESEPSALRTSYGALVGSSEPMQTLYAQLTRIEQSGAPVSIEGETGTGKELIARAIHDHGSRSAEAYVIADCASVPHNLVESELFGHVRGAFTGADRNRDGAFVKADRGTIFLDEIGELPLDVQPKLLRVLETGEVKPLGGERYRRVDVRLITATHRDLAAEVEAGRFRADLYYRVAVLPVRAPPLRARTSDLPLLCAALAERSGIDDAAIPAAALDFFNRYDWPGNVRELKNAIMRVAALGAYEPPLSSEPIERANAAFEGQKFRDARKKAIASFEEAYLRDVWARTGNVSAAAREAGIDRKHVRELLKKYGLYDQGGNV